MSDFFNKESIILIVDDNPQNVEILWKALKNKNYKIIMANSGIQALRVIDEIIPDLILLDIMMPNMNGFEVCEKLKASPETQHIPIIFLTALTDSEDIIKGFEYGAMDYITKPFNLPELLVRVNTHLELKFSKELLLEKNAEQKELLHILCHDLANPMSLVKIFLELSESRSDDWLLEQKPSMLQAMENGLKIIELVREVRVLDEKKGKINLIPCNLRNLVSESLMILQPQFTQKNIAYEMNIDESLTVLGEKTSFINSVLNNIFTNAIKFSFPDSIITVNARQEGETVIVTITDTGIGMSPKLLEDVFDISQPTTRRGTNGEKGTGFGMPLMKKFITIFGGDIEISSKEKKTGVEDHGTTVKLILKSGQN